MNNLSVEPDGLASITVPTHLEELIDRQLPDLCRMLATHQKGKANAIRVDGQIIGTGEADFTKGNTLYTLNYKGKTFQLIDVPGIEGDESKYANMVHEAVAKGHLVFYVNGTNKKPEKATAEKIRAYLRRGTQVCPIINSRGNADSYEFEEDRISLEQHGSATNALKQTTEVLKAVVGKDVLLSGLCVQGLLAFSSLAMSFQTKQTTIHPSRKKDLVIQQHNYLRYFQSPKKMYEFSQIKDVAKVMHAKLGTFKEDIIESNKAKVLELLNENIGHLEQTHKNHQIFIAKANPEFTKCRDSIQGATESFERLVAAGRRNLWNNFFNDVSGETDEIIAGNFGKNDLVATKINQALMRKQETMATEVQKQLDQNLSAMQDSIKQALERLIQDVMRIEFQQGFSLGENGYQPVYRADNLDMSLQWGDWGKIAIDVGSYAWSGAVIGSSFPIIGTLIGAVIGGVVGMLVSAMNLFVSKEKRIRKAQLQVQGKIEEARATVMGGLPSEIQHLMTSIGKDVQENVRSRVDAIYASLTSPLAIIEQQISVMTRIKKQLEDMPY